MPPPPPPLPLLFRRLLRTREEGGKQSEPPSPPLPPPKWGNEAKLEEADLVLKDASCCHLSSRLNINNEAKAPLIMRRLGVEAPKRDSEIYTPVKPLPRWDEP